MWRSCSRHCVRRGSNYELMFLKMIASVSKTEEEIKKVLLDHGVEKACRLHPKKCNVFQKAYSPEKFCYTF